MHRVNPTTTRDERLAGVVAAMRRLHAAGQERVGPKQIAREVGAPWAFVKGEPSASIVTCLLATLCQQGAAERLPQGLRRAVYRLVEEF